jgi:glycine dehydrogenase subunit 2
MMERLIFDYSEPGRRAADLPRCEEGMSADPLLSPFIDERLTPLPEVSEQEVIRHYIALSGLNYHVDKGVYPLGSCTMKYNPKLNETVARMEGFSHVHPYSADEDVQGLLGLLYDLEKELKVITGMDSFTFQPAAGAHGELAGIKIFKKYFDCKNEKRTKIIVPDSAHGTNPATSAMAGFDVITIPSNKQGGVDLAALEEAMNEDVAGLMLTNPNTLGLFDKNILKIASIVHKKGGLLYYDGANLNACMGISRPGDMGFDIVHLNLHKTFSTPHGGGGPGSGPIGVKKHLRDYLPVPLVEKKGRRFFLDYDLAHSIGKLHGFYGNFGVVVKAYVYVKKLGSKGLRHASRMACLNANYLQKRLRKKFRLAYDRICKHEFVLSGDKFKKYGVRTLDIAKRMLDYGVHAPTVYFPLIVDEALMIEPTETESKQTLDRLTEIMCTIADEARKNPELLHEAPLNTPVSRLDEAGAVKEPDLAYRGDL